MRAAAEQARARAEELAPIVADLEFADDARAAWRFDSAVIRDRAERARYAAGMRGIDLDDPGDRVTAQEWLDADLAEKLAADAERAITEHDLDSAVDRVEAAPDDHNQSDERRVRPDEPVIEPAPPDIRETTIPDPTERADPAERHRIPPRDETTATVDRAALVVADIEQRRVAEAAEQARTAQVGPDEDDRRDDLTRWDQTDAPTTHQDDTAVDEYDTDRGDVG